MSDLISRQKAIDIVISESTADGAYGYVDTKSVVRLINSLPSAHQWIPVTERLPEDLKPVNITYINEDPAPYYEHIKGIPFTATAIYYRGGWYWWSCICADVLAEYGYSYSNLIDEGIEVTAWMPLPEPYEEDK